jgi:hypothetical protein|tara:strand:- start:210 stop:650 length:441 start_codon:yes stop_codon:yes gene_type:complete
MLKKSTAVICVLYLSLISLPSFSETDDDFREKQIESINKADGFKYISGVRRPIRLENGLHMHGWLYNKKLDITTIQYTYAGQLSDSHKDQMAQAILSKWKGEIGSQFRKWGFKDISIMITEGIKTRVYSSKHDKWCTVDEYLALRF